MVTCTGDTQSTSTTGNHLLTACSDVVHSTQLHQRKINSGTVIPAPLWKAARMHQIPVCLSACLHKFGARVGDLGAVIVAELDVWALVKNLGPTVRGGHSSIFHKE